MGIIENNQATINKLSETKEAISSEFIQKG
jgi:hypothetical protein